MNEVMGQSHLVQRLKKPVGYSNPYSFGGGLKNGGVKEDAMKKMGEIFSFDYMGAAEFEYGKLPEILSKILNNNSDFIRGSMKTCWKTVPWRTREELTGNAEIYYLCHKNQEKEVKKRIAGWAMGNNVSGHTKCSVCLDSNFDDGYYSGWLELDNGFFFFVDKPMWEQTSKLFEIEGV